MIPSWVLLHAADEAQVVLGGLFARRYWRGFEYRCPNPMRYADYDPDDRDAPLPEDLDDGDDEPDETVACPSCRRRIHEDAALCPHCGEWIIDDSPAAQRSRGWFWPLMVGALVAMILSLWVGLR
jgi:predicted RNA-binding Zn-ribbon protein involved in translation (DUF1610 family)